MNNNIPYILISKKNYSFFKSLGIYQELIGVEIVNLISYNQQNQIPQTQSDFNLTVHPLNLTEKPCNGIRKQCSKVDTNCMVNKK